MNIRNIYFVIVLCIAIMVCRNSAADIGSVVSSGRAGGVNVGWCASADDIFAMQYNPAGLCRLSYPGFASSIGSSFLSLSDNTNLQQSFLGYVHPFKRLIPWKKDPRFLRDQALGVGLYNFSSGSLFKEQVLYVSYAQKIYPLVSAGITVKQFTRKYGSDAYRTSAVDDWGQITNNRDAFFDAGTSKHAVSFDLGMLYRFGPFTRYSIGCALLNVNQPDMALGDTADKIPFKTVIGFAYRFPKLNLSVDWMRGRMLAAGNENRLGIVGEKWFVINNQQRISARGTLAIGSRSYR
ncbi:MAG: hypothetical protein GF384_01170, partial [Elusimicrobia bacterium]|nr:hypothetical protein [Elusimicrobiota bacterium]